MSSNSVPASQLVSSGDAGITGRARAQAGVGIDFDPQRFMRMGLHRLFTFFSVAAAAPQRINISHREPGSHSHPFTRSRKPRGLIRQQIAARRAKDSGRH